MNWKNFVSLGYPCELAQKESTKEIVFRAHRWFGVRIAYIFYHFGISANSTTVIRLVLVVFGLYLLFQTTKSYLQYTGIFFLFLQNLLDYSDGVIARVANQATRFGEKFDGIVNAFARGTILLLFGYTSQEIIFFIMSSFSVFILINFKESFTQYQTYSFISKCVSYTFRISLAIQFMLVILPILSLISSVASTIISIYYFSLSLLLLTLCRSRKIFVVKN